MADGNQPQLRLDSGCPPRGRQERHRRTGGHRRAERGVGHRLHRHRAGAGFRVRRGGRRMSTLSPGPNPLADLPPMAGTGDPGIVPRLVRGLALTPRAPTPVLTARPRVPMWISPPDLIASIEAGLIEIPDDLNTRRVK